MGVGGVDEIGYLAPDGHGTLRYVSLLTLLPPGQRKLGQVLLDPGRSARGSPS